MYVNGKLQPKGAPVRIPAGQAINSMNVLKGKDAKSKYGRDAKDGAIEITTTKKARRGYGIDRDNAARGFSFNFIGEDGENSTFHIEGDFADMANLESLSELEQLDLSELRKFGDVRVEANINEGDVQALIDRAMTLANAAGRNADIAHRNAERSATIRARAEERRADISRRREDMKASREDLRKELEEARKELEQARKELKKQSEKRRAEMNKKA